MLRYKEVQELDPHEVKRLVKKYMHGSENSVFESYAPSMVEYIRTQGWELEIYMKQPKTFIAYIWAELGGEPLAFNFSGPSMANALGKALIWQLQKERK